jgi:hypothetical protein
MRFTRRDMLTAGVALSGGSLLAIGACAFVEIWVRPCHDITSASLPPAIANP